MLRLALPDPWARVFVTRGIPATARGWAYVLAALVLGAYSHWIADGFTHHWLWPARVLYADVRVGPLRVSQFLHVIASVVGSGVAVVWLRVRARACPRVETDPRWRRRLVGEQDPRSIRGRHGSDSFLRFLHV